MGRRSASEWQAMPKPKPTGSHLTRSAARSAPRSRTDRTKSPCETPETPDRDQDSSSKSMNSDDESALHYNDHTSREDDDTLLNEAAVDEQLQTTVKALKQARGASQQLWRQLIWTYSRKSGPINFPVWVLETLDVELVLGRLIDTYGYASLHKSWVLDNPTNKRRLAEHFGVPEDQQILLALWLGGDTRTPAPMTVSRMLKALPADLDPDRMRTEIYPKMLDSYAARHRLNLERPSDRRRLIFAHKDTTKEPGISWSVVERVLKLKAEEDEEDMIVVNGDGDNESNTEQMDVDMNPQDALVEAVKDVEPESGSAPYPTSRQVHCRAVQGGHDAAGSDSRRHTCAGNKTSDQQDKNMHVASIPQEHQVTPARGLNGARDKQQHVTQAPSQPMGIAQHQNQNQNQNHQQQQFDQAATKNATADHVQDDLNFDSTLMTAASSPESGRSDDILFTPGTSRRLSQPSMVTDASSPPDLALHKPEPSPSPSGPGFDGAVSPKTLSTPSPAVSGGTKRPAEGPLSPATPRKRVKGVDGLPELSPPGLELGDRLMSPSSTSARREPVFSPGQAAQRHPSAQPIAVPSSQSGHVPLLDGGAQQGASLSPIGIVGSPWELPRHKTPSADKDSDGVGAGDGDVRVDLSQASPDEEEASPADKTPDTPTPFKDLMPTWQGCIKRLADGGQLNDTLVDQFVEMVAFSHPAFTTMSSTRLLGTKDSEDSRVFPFRFIQPDGRLYPNIAIIFNPSAKGPHIPVSSGHWALLHIDMQANSALVYDSASMLGGAVEHAQRIIGDLNDRVPGLEVDFPAKRAPCCPQQMDATSCGVFAVVMAWFVIRGEQLPETLDMAVWRGLLRAMATGRTLRQSFADLCVATDVVADAAPVPTMRLPMPEAQLSFGLERLRRQSVEIRRQLTVAVLSYARLVKEYRDRAARIREMTTIMLPFLDSLRVAVASQIAELEKGVAAVAEAQAQCTATLKTTVLLPEGEFAAAVESRGRKLRLLYKEQNRRLRRCREAQEALGALGIDGKLGIDLAEAMTRYDEWAEQAEGQRERNENALGALAAAEEV